jgi:hypothetical protein
MARKKVAPIEADRDVLLAQMNSFAKYGWLGCAVFFCVWP